ncbi:MAG: hypothetical protein IPM18_14045 [Phycisphaerales bacterium]|nr:hypothetical protein [Phycisphaerales bacterium]
MAQTLLRKLCPSCTVTLEETADVTLLDDVLRHLEPGERPMLSFGRGCADCRFSGYRGRTGIFEVLVADDDVRRMISQGATARTIYDWAAANELLTIAQAGSWRGCGA